VVSTQDTAVGGTPPPVPPAGPPPDRRIGLGMLLALGVAALVALGIALAWYFTHHHGSRSSTTTVIVSTNRAPAVHRVPVPRVVGLQQQQAVALLTKDGLQAKPVFRQTRQPTGVVVAQSPKEATNVKKGTQVTIVVDRGAPKVAVPDVRGMSLSSAESKLAAVGLKTARTTVTSSKPTGTVVDEAPSPGSKLAKGSTVTLSVAKRPTTTATTTVQATTTTATTTTGTTTARTTTAPAHPSSATVPNVVGQQEEAAVQAFAQAGILPSIVFIPGSQTLGTVVQQAQSAGSTVPYHAHVQLNVSRGPNNNPLEPVPNIVGMSLQQAVSALNEHHLRLIYVKYPVTQKSQAGKIVQQTPLSGAKAPANGQVVAFMAAVEGGA
jgi:serine/threonine-protein kinase